MYEEPFVWETQPAQTMCASDPHRAGPLYMQDWFIVLHHVSLYFNRNLGSVFTIIKV